MRHSCLNRLLTVFTFPLQLERSDLHAHRQVQAIEGRDLARMRAWRFVECSSLTGDNVQAVFDTAIRAANQHSAAGTKRSPKKKKRSRHTDDVEAGADTMLGGAHVGQHRSATEVLCSGHSDAIWRIVAVPSLSGDRLFTASRDGTIRVWSCISGRCIAVLVGHTDEVLELIVDKVRPVGQTFRTLIGSTPVLVHAHSPNGFLIRCAVCGQWPPTCPMLGTWRGAPFELSRWNPSELGSREHTRCSARSSRRERGGSRCCRGCWRADHADG
jgi:hypothetical protein